ncbi:unnamed protein product [Moneuplotes crassus]|uniref:Uncharacterized protein n=1 Tax=Euplotes crassus TaxID=5936 RepID=A0AAD1XLU3_EUPCR|nr:unnamed protein product [Moneuplotes crassus]
MEITCCPTLVCSLLLSRFSSPSRQTILWFNWHYRIRLVMLEHPCYFSQLQAGNSFILFQLFELPVQVISFLNNFISLFLLGSDFLFIIFLSHLIFFFCSLNTFTNVF